MATKTKNTKVSEDGFTKLATQDEAPSFDPSEWVEPGEGTVIEGELIRGFVVPDDLGNNPRKPFRACYTVRDANGAQWTFGEKAAFRDAIQSRRSGAWIRLTYLKKEKMVDPKTKKPGAKTIWRVDFGERSPGSGELMVDMLKADVKNREKTGADMPF